MRAFLLLVAASPILFACAPDMPDTSVPVVVTAAGSGNGVTADWTVTVSDSAGAGDIIAVYWSDNGGANHLCTLVAGSASGAEENWDCSNVPDGRTTTSASRWRMPPASPAHSDAGRMFLESVIRPLILLHALIAVTLLGSVGHLGWESFHYLLGRTRNVWLGTVHARVGFVLYAGNFLLGLLIYPTYRVRVRQEVFDIRMPWATNLFDSKEFLAAFGLAAFAALFLMSFAVDPRSDEDRSMLPTFAGLGVLVASITTYCALVGLTLVTYKTP